MNAGFSIASFLFPLLGSLPLCLAGAKRAVASVADQATGMPATLSTGADSSTPMTDIHDIKPVLAFDAHWQWWVWLLIALALAFVAALIWWLRRRRSLTGQKDLATPAIPPDVEALQQLDALTARGTGNPKRFYFSLSAVLRHYVERRFDFPAAEMTTEELLPQVRRLPLEDTLAQDFKRFCLSSDPIKFADAIADQTRMSQDIAFARQFVEQTTMAAAVAEDDQINAPPPNGSKTTSPKQLIHQNPEPERSA